MTDVYVECQLPAALRQHDQARVCLALHRVQWLTTLKRPDSDRVLCHFRAPDAESVRIALRHLQIDINSLWIDGAASLVQ